MMKNFIIERAKKEIKSAIKEYKRINENEEVDSFDSKELFVAVRNGDDSEVKNLLDSGSNPNVVDESTGFTPLHIAYTLGKDSIQLFVDKGADVNAKAKSGTTPLHNFAFFRDFDAMSILINAGAKPDEKDMSGNTPLIYLCKRSEEQYKDETPTEQIQKCIDLLKQARVNFNVRNRREYSPLLIAYDLGDEELMKMLVNAGANPENEGPEIKNSIKSIVGSQPVSESRKRKAKITKKFLMGESSYPEDDPSNKFVVLAVRNNKSRGHSVNPATSPYEMWFKNINDAQKHRNDLNVYDDSDDSDGNNSPMDVWYSDILIINANEYRDFHFDYNSGNWVNDAEKKIVEGIEWESWVKATYSDVRKIINKYYRLLDDHNFLKTKDPNVTLVRIEGKRELIDKIKKELNDISKK
jgi:flagellar basal body-associated protein FliL